MGSSPIRVAILIPFASVAQLVEQRTENPRVVGSIPTGGTSDRWSLRGFSSFGRARPCQGRGGGFEPRNPLQKGGGIALAIPPPFLKLFSGRTPNIAARGDIPSASSQPSRGCHAVLRHAGFRALVGSGFLFVPSVSTSGLNPGSEPSSVQFFSPHSPCAIPCLISPAP